jgi:60 kDa SS-A/Ro ribonucleoprotein
VARKSTYSGVGVTKSVATPQTQPIPGRESAMEMNAAGGYGYSMDCFAKLERFLILGTEGGTYYVNEKKLTIQNYESLKQCLVKDWKRTVDLIVDVSVRGRAAKQEPTLFAFAICASDGNSLCVKYTFSKLNEVCRIGTHLFMFVEYMNERRGWGRAVRTGIANWYLSKKPSNLELQLAKYQQRNGWSHTDIIRLAHPVANNAVDPARTNNLFKWSLGKECDPEQFVGLVKCLERMKKATTSKEIVALIHEYQAPREVIPTEYMKDPEVWKAMLYYMGAQAMVRNLGNLGRNGVFDSPEYVKLVCDKFNDAEWIRSNRLHPVKSLIALKQYQQGHGDKSDSTWPVNRQVALALENAFYNGFAAVEPTNKRISYNLDVSGSMGMSSICGINDFTPREATAALALVLASTETDYKISAFADRYTDISNLVKSGMRLMEATKNISCLPFGRTDCALPMTTAQARGEKYDAFVILTDNETWYGSIHPSQALKNYRQAMNIPDAKLVVVAMTASSTSIADPNDRYMIDVCGFDADLPEFITNFIKG